MSGDEPYGDRRSDWPMPAPVRFADRPDEGVRLIRRDATTLVDLAGTDAELMSTATRLAIHVLALDAWIRSGGELPREWRLGQPKGPVRPHG